MNRNPFRRGVLAPQAVVARSRPLPQQGLKWALLAAAIPRLQVTLKKGDVRGYLALNRLRGVCLSVGREPVEFRAVLAEVRAVAGC